MEPTQLAQLEAEIKAHDWHQGPTVTHYAFIERLRAHPCHDVMKLLIRYVPPDELNITIFRLTFVHRKQEKSPGA